MKVFFQIVPVFLFVFVLFTNETKSANDVIFYNLNNEYGMSVRETNQVLADDYGFVWVSSKMAILRVTQNDIRSYQLPYESEDILTVRLTYSHGVLYAYTNNGQLFTYNPIQDKFDFLVNVSEGVDDSYILVNRIITNEYGNVWIASSSGLYVYEPGEGFNTIVKDDNVFDVVWLDDDNFFYAVGDVVNIYNVGGEFSKEYYQFSEADNYKISKLYYNRKNRMLWVGTVVNGLFYLKPNSENDLEFGKVNGIPGQPVLAIAQNNDSTLMLGIDGQGLWMINSLNFNVISVYKDNSNNPHSLKGNGVYDIYCDDNDRVWVCTYSGGVSYFNDQKTAITTYKHEINNRNSLVNDDVNGIIEDSDGNLWFATNNGISFFDQTRQQWESYFHDKMLHAQVFNDLCEDDEGRIWAGTYSSGVYILNRKTGEVIDHIYTKSSSAALNTDFVLDIFKDSQGNMWIGGSGGDLICYNAEEKQFRSYPEVSLKVLSEYYPGKIMIGSTVGMQILDVKTGELEWIVNDCIVHDILLQSNIVWLATSGSGIIKYDFDTKKAEKFTVDSGLPSNYVNSLLDAGGYLWIGTENGLCKFDMNSNVFHTFNSSPTLSNVSLNRHAYYVLGNGEIIWGSNKGAMAFEPGLHPRNDFDGQIFIQDMRIAGTSVRDSAVYQLETILDSLNDISLKYNQNTLSVELIPVGITIPDVKFSWKMENVDQKWSRPLDNNIISYSNIPNGETILMIRMYDNSLTHIIDQRQIKIYVSPPFWKQWWFIALIISIIPILVYLEFQYYIYRLKKRHSDDKIRFFLNTAHNLRNSLTLVNGPIEELNKETSLSDKGNYFLSVVTEQAQHLFKVVTGLMDFHKVDIGKEKLYRSMTDVVCLVKTRLMMNESYARSRNIDIEFSSNCTEYITAIDEIMFEKVIDNLISNAIKYSSPGKKVYVNVECDKDKWVLEVKDEGIGISKKDQKQLFREFYRGDNAVNSRIVGSGIGLLLVKNYVTLHNGRISCKSQLNAGSTFQVSIPYQNAESVEVKRVDAESRPPLNIKADADNVLGVENDKEQQSETKRKILIVEDNDDLRDFLLVAMDADFTVSVASDGLMAWDLINKESFELVISDIVMPGLDGFGLCSKIKSSFETSHIPIILLTALTGKAQELRGLKLGADDYLSKPFDVTILQQRVKSILNNRAIIREKALKIITPEEDNEVVLEDNELNDRFLKDIIDIARKNVGNEKFSRDDFAMAMNISPSLLYKKTKALTGLSPTDFIKSVRLEYALKLLKQKKYSITEVSELCGFSNVGYFGTVFRRYYGKSPSQVKQIAAKKKSL